VATLAQALAEQVGAAASVAFARGANTLQFRDQFSNPCRAR
jgi:hypothetical protein